MSCSTCSYIGFCGFHIFNSPVIDDMMNCSRTIRGLVMAMVIDIGFRKFRAHAPTSLLEKMLRKRKHTSLLPRHILIHTHTNISQNRTNPLSSPSHVKLEGFRSARLLLSVGFCIDKHESPVGDFRGDKIGSHTVILTGCTKCNLLSRLQ